MQALLPIADVEAALPCTSAHDVALSEDDCGSDVAGPHEAVSLEDIETAAHYTRCGPHR